MPPYNFSFVRCGVEQEEGRGPPSRPRGCHPHTRARLRPGHERPLRPLPDYTGPAAGRLEQGS
jgi:hypothetical protein